MSEVQVISLANGYKTTIESLMLKRDPRYHLAAPGQRFTSEGWTL